MIDQLVKALKDNKNNYRWVAAIVLVELGADATEAESALREASNDPDEDVRRYAKEALKKIKVQK